MAFKITYPGINDLVAFTYNNSNGITPGRCALTILPQNADNIKIAARTFSIENLQANVDIVMRYAMVDRGSYQYNAAGEVVSLVVLDRRWAWENQNITGAYNLRKGSGLIYDDESDEVGDDDIINNTRVSLRSLLSVLLDRMGYLEGPRENWSSFYIDDQADDILYELYPTVFWDYANPAIELQTLCDYINFQIVYDPSFDFVVLEPKGRETYSKNNEKQILSHDAITSRG